MFFLVTVLLWWSMIGTLCGDSHYTLHTLDGHRGDTHTHYTFDGHFLHSMDTVLCGTGGSDSVSLSSCPDGASRSTQKGQGAFFSHCTTQWTENQRNYLSFWRRFLVRYQLWHSNHTWHVRLREHTVMTKAPSHLYSMISLSFVFYYFSGGYSKLHDWIPITKIMYLHVYHSYLQSRLNALF